MGSNEKVRLFQLNLSKELAHGICVSNLASLIAKELALPDKLCYDLAVAGFLHDVGKLAAEKYVRAKGDTLTIEEMKYIRTHSTVGYVLLNEAGYNKFIAESVLYHHENYDGSGYPGNLYQEDIPFGARILRVCDTFAALISDRPYRKAFDIDTAVELMIEEAKNFDMLIFLAFLRVIHEDGFDEILAKSREEFELSEEDLL
ncbi:MAG: HD domain-containing phosphohydrolase [Candidatus Limivivens sp.]|nr:HD domain-containing phosphohydrolase [Candidatus Limivivens sp.]